MRATRFEIGEITIAAGLSPTGAVPMAAPAAMGRFPIDDAELSPPSALANMEPDEQHFQEATGNEGASFERTTVGRRWCCGRWSDPAVLNQAGLPVTLPYLSELTERWVASGGDRESPLWREAHQLSGHSCAPGASPPTIRGVTARVKAPVMLGVDGPIQGHRAHRSDHGRHHRCGRPWQERQRVAAAGPGLLPRSWPNWSSASSPPTPRCAFAAAPTCSLAACESTRWQTASFLPGRLWSGLPGDPAQVRKADFAWQRQPIDVGFVVDIVSGFRGSMSSFGGLHGDTSTGLAESMAGDEHPARRPSTDQRDRNPSLAAVRRLRAVCLEHLRARMALALEAPGDWTRAGAPVANVPLL